MDIARGIRVSTFGRPADTLVEAQAANELQPAAYYLRMELQDKPGALAKIATLLGEHGISIDRMRQYNHEMSTAPVLIVTHKTTKDALTVALDGFSATGVVATPPVAIRIEEV